MKIELFVYHDFEKFRNNKLISDLTLFCQGQEFPVHKFILCATSEYFYGLLCGPLSKSDNRIEITMTCPKILSLFLDYVYGKYELEVSDWREAIEFYKFLDYACVDFDRERNLILYTDGHYVEYLEYVSDFYEDNEIPEEFLEKSSRTITTEDDLSELDPEILEFILKEGTFRLKRGELLKLLENCDLRALQWLDERQSVLTEDSPFG